MLVKLQPSEDQLRWYVQSALSGFDTLDADDAIENAKADMRAILAYLDAIDNAKEVLARDGIKSILVSPELMDGCSK